MSSRDIRYDYGVRADGCIITNRNRSEQLCPSSNVDAVPDGWRATMSAMAKTDRDAISEYNIVPKHSIAADHNVEGMLD
jgi:phage FluMu gp28-like protein